VGDVNPDAVPLSAGTPFLHILHNLIEATIQPGAVVLTDEYTIYNRLPKWGFEHKTVCHNTGGYARDEDGDGSI